MIALYERSAEMNPFSSKFDAWQAGKCQLTEEEKLGYELFKEKGLCAECHILDPDERAGKVLFTDHTYDNLGIPSNPGNPFFKVSAPLAWAHDCVIRKNTGSSVCLRSAISL